MPDTQTAVAAGVLGVLFLLVLAYIIAWVMEQLAKHAAIRKQQRWLERELEQYTLLSSEEEEQAEDVLVFVPENPVSVGEKEGEKPIAMQETPRFTVSYVVKNGNGVETVKQAELSEFDLGVITGLARLIGAARSGAHKDALKVAETVGLKVACEVSPGKGEKYLIAQATLKHLLEGVAAPVAERDPITDVTAEGRVIRTSEIEAAPA